MLKYIQVKVGFSRTQLSKQHDGNNRGPMKMLLAMEAGIKLKTCCVINKGIICRVLNSQSRSFLFIVRPWGWLTEMYQFRKTQAWQWINISSLCKKMEKHKCRRRMLKKHPSNLDYSKVLILSLFYESETMQESHVKNTPAWAAKPQNRSWFMGLCTVVNRVV